MAADATQYLYAGLTAMVCIAIAGVCLCRLHLMTSAYRVGVRIRFACMGSVAILFGCSPWAGEWPGWTGLVFALGALVSLLIDWRQWENGAPVELRHKEDSA